MATQETVPVSVELNVPATMRDGTTLLANIYRPAQGQWPVLLMRTPYGKDLPMAAVPLDPVQIANRGYVVVIQDCRGRMASQGDRSPYRNEALDGVDTIAWAAQLPYSNGDVGMFGMSYMGADQWLTALHQPAALKVIAPLLAWNNPLNGSNFRAGAFELGRMVSWNLMMGMGVLMRRHRADPAALGRSIAALVQQHDKLGTEGYWSLPLKQFSSLIDLDIAPSFFDALEHPMDRAFYDEITMRGKQQSVTVPSFNVSGWYDVFLQDTLDNFSQTHQHGSTPEARQSKLLVGPWSHGNFSNPIGDINFGFAASAALINLQSDLGSLQMRWFDHWLKGSDTGITSEAPIKLFVMGANIWRDEYEWPLTRAVETRFYLHSNGQANSLNGDGRLSTEPPTTEESDHYTYDPAHPVITRGGNLLMALEFPGGPFDQRPTESRTDVLVYSTPPLEQDLEVTGRIRVHLWAISSAPDTDFVARLVDVHPDGYARNLADGIIRARYRNIESGAAPTLIEPGKAYEYEIDLWSTSNLFKAGHRIRLDITSSNFPRWDRNPNTGHPLGSDAELVEANQTILHDQEHPSYVVLPVIPNP